MIVGERKPYEEIKSMLEGSRKILLAGCGTCVKVCFTGGDKEVALLASQLRLSAKKDKRNIHIMEMTVERQCENEFIEEIAPYVDAYDVIMSMACGAGVQMLAQRFPEKIVLPAVNTTFLGLLEKTGFFVENCQGCGNCVLGDYGGVCPVTRCAKSIFNGPCGGSQNGMCEVDPQTPCAWELIISRLRALGQLERLSKTTPPKDWSSARDGGQRKLTREEQILS